MSEARFDTIDIDERFERMDVRMDRMDVRMDDRMDRCMERIESNLLAITESTARIEGALPHIATKEDVAEAKLYATKSQRAMVASIIAAGVAIGGVVARLWPA